MAFVAGMISFVLLLFHITRADYTMIEHIIADVDKDIVHGIKWMISMGEILLLDWPDGIV